MIFLTFFYILTKSKIITHNCHSRYVNLDVFQNESIDYRIDCPPKKTQKIIFNNTDHIKTISIFENSNVIIHCPSSTAQYNNLSLLLFDNSHISFKQHCNFNKIEIFDSPTIDKSSSKYLTVETLFLFNSTYNYSFTPKRVTYAPQIANYKKIKTQILESETDTNVFQCQTYLSFQLSDKVDIKCEKSFTYSLNYDDLQYFRFINYNKPVTIKKKIDYDLNYDLIEIVTKSLFFHGSQSIVFSNFFDMDLLDKFLEDYKSEGSQLLFDADWSTIMYYNLCPWIDGKYNKEYEYLQTYFNDIENKTDWRKICIDEKAYLHYQGDDHLKGIVVITRGKLFGISAVIIILVILIVISLFFISSWKYSKEHLEISDNENDSSNVIKNENDSSGGNKNGNNKVI